MFKNLLEFWSGKDFLGQVLDDFMGMLKDTENMFGKAYGRLFEVSGDPGLKDELYAIDRRVNEVQRSIRKRIIEHLSIQPTVETTTCLLLMSVTKDAERIGDFSKNIYEVSTLLEKPLDRETYDSLFGNVAEEIQKLFKETVTAFMKSDEETAKLTWERQRKIKQTCNEVIRQISSSELSVNEAVAFALMSRYFIRTAAHLTNIATSVVVPLDNLDYFDESMLNEY